MRSILAAATIAASTFSVPATAATFVYDFDIPGGTFVGNIGYTFNIAPVNLAAGDVVDITFNVLGNKLTSPRADGVGSGLISLGSGVIRSVTNSYEFEGLETTGFETFGGATANTIDGLYGFALPRQGVVSGLSFSAFRQTLTFNSGTAGTFSSAYIFISGGVPEPTTWALMIAGFGLVGGSLRHRRQATGQSAGLGVPKLV